jgi:septal ring factor EnvC (AmiA/AmiB activator)
VRPEAGGWSRGARAWVWAIACALAPVPGLEPLVPVLHAQDSKVRQQRAELDRIRQERANLEKQMRELQSTVHTLDATVRNLDRRTDATSRLVRGLDRQLMLISAEVIAANDNMARAEAELTRKRAILRRRVVDIYKRGPLYDVEVMLASQSFGELVARYKYLHLLALRDRAVVHQVEQLRNTVAIERDRLVRLQQNINDTRLERQREADELKTLTAEQREALARTRRLQRQTEARLARARQTENQMSNAIAAFEAERRRLEAARPAARRTASTVRTSDYGKLDWPVEGPLVYSFGREVQPNNTSIKWNGVGIRAATGTAVKSVSSGRVVSVRQLGTYGLTVILEHGGGDYTIYGSLQTATVKVGQTVAKGAKVGEVGISDPELPPHLHFEVRQGGPAVDPATWLRRR